ncbi:MAG: hypothetical protein HKO65_14260 [Gemmatimonadetes bacterium]|nr:hypothetical protein [Gemmatimonadota bacterium]NNM06250.1 hypothetical protein [Gemmatimonadota bacterium]
MNEIDDRELDEEGGTLPIKELSDFEFPSDTEFSDRVRQSIGNREVVSGIVDLSTWGFFRLLIGYLSTLLGALGSPSGPDTGQKE